MCTAEVCPVDHGQERGEVEASDAQGEREPGGFSPDLGVLETLFLEPLHT